MSFLPDKEKRKTQRPSLYSGLYSLSDHRLTTGGRPTGERKRVCTWVLLNILSLFSLTTVWRFHHSHVILSTINTTLFSFLHTHARTHARTSIKSSNSSANTSFILFFLFSLIFNSNGREKKTQTRNKLAHTAWPVFLFHLYCMMRKWRWWS
jgi:hypothetical protein